MVATATISAFVTLKWGMFAPRDYEECAQSAAKDAKSKDALSVLVSICSSEFKGRRKIGGGYSYYDNCQDRTFDIKEPNPTPDELKYIEGGCLAYLDAQAQVAAKEEETKRRVQQAAQEASARLQVRKLAAIPAIRVTSKDFCETDFSDLSFCKLNVEATNGSTEALLSITIGLSTVPTSTDACPPLYASKENLNILLSPGESRGWRIPVLSEFKKYHVCIKVLDVEFIADRGR
jgi:hypothetical protein